MKIYEKGYTRENSLIAFEIWEHHQQSSMKQKLGVVVPFAIFDVTDGIATVYYGKKTSKIWKDIIVKNSEKNKNFVREIMEWYGENLNNLETIWHKKKKLNSLKELIDFFELSAMAWVGLSVSYFLPGLENVTQKNQDLGMALRKRSSEFLELTDHVILATLRKFYPELGVLIKYISIEDIKKNKLPSVKSLKERQKHYIYYKYKVITNTLISNFLKENRIQIITEKIKYKNEIQGQVAMTGRVRGKIRVLLKKSQIPELKKGEILVTAMTTPDYLPAMEKAAAFITDEGGITCHAAIVARELKKPCIIGTKVATQVFKNGDTVEVDANKGIVRKL